MRVLRAADRPATPWKNGGGVTREIAVHPPGAGMNDFLWRVSIAEVTQDGPFSHFDGIDRTLMVLEGRLGLNVAGLDVVLDAGGAGFRFAGDVTVDGALQGGPVTDLNAMTRRSRYRADMRRAAGRVSVNGETVFIIAQAPVAVSGVELDRHDALLIEAADEMLMDIGQAGAVIVELSGAGGDEQ